LADAGQVEKEGNSAADRGYERERREARLEKAEAEVEAEQSEATSPGVGESWKRFRGLFDSRLLDSRLVLEDFLVRSDGSNDDLAFAANVGCPIVHRNAERPLLRTL